MRSNRWVALITILILLLVACTAGGEESAASEPAPTATRESGLATVPPTEDGDRAQEEEATVEKVEATMSAREEDSPDGDSSSEDTIAPAEVDLNEVTPDAGVEGIDGGSAVEMPEPGRPKPQVAMIHQATQDLVERLQIDVDDVKVGTVEEVQWSDGSLGCPAEDAVYQQAITPGFRITLQAQGEIYQYHTDRSHTVILCSPDGRPVTE